MRLRQLLAPPALLALASCASVNPDTDISESADLVAARDAARPAWTSAPDAPPWNGTTLSSDDAVSIALERNPEMRRAVTSIASARAALAQAQTPPNPMATLTIGLPIDGSVGSMVTAAAMQQIAWLWQRPARSAAEESRLRAAILSTADRAVGLAAEVRERHLDVVAAEAELAAARAAQGAASAAARATAALVDGGSLPSSARAASDELASAALRVETDAQLVLDLARVRLLEAMGCADATHAWSTDGTWPVIVMNDEALDRVVALSIARRLDVAAADAIVVAARADADAAGASRISNVSIGAEYEKQSDGSKTLGPSLAAEVPIFDRGDARVASSVAALDAAQWSAQSTRQAAAAAAQRAAFAARVAYRQWNEGSEQARRSAEARAAAVRSARGAGLASLMEVSDAERMLAERTLEALRDRRSAAAASIALNRSLVGGAP